MGPILYSASALLVWIAATTVTNLTTGFVASYFGIRVREIAIGCGPTLFKKVGPSWTFRIAAIPLGGYTQLLRKDDLEDPKMVLPPDGPSHQGSGRYHDAAPLAQMLTAVSGPLATALLGLVCITLPVWAGAPQLEACPADESLVRPCGVPGLTLRGQAADWPAQWALFRDTVLTFFLRLATFQSLEGWGGGVAFFVTCGPLGTLSLGAWLSALGVLLLGFAAFNLLPVPLLNGFRLVQALGRWVTARELPENAQLALTYVGLLAMLVLVGRAAWVDLRWLWRAWLG
jgi:membrane-associated protease RseP (regulator of RpoE activity)